MQEHGGGVLVRALFCPEACCTLQFHPEMPLFFFLGQHNLLFSRMPMVGPLRARDPGGSPVGVPGDPGLRSPAGPGAPAPSQSCLAPRVAGLRRGGSMHLGQVQLPAHGLRIGKSFRLCMPSGAALCLLVAKLVYM